MNVVIDVCRMFVLWFVPIPREGDTYSQEKWGNIVASHGAALCTKLGIITAASSHCFLSNLNKQKKHLKKG